MPFGKKKVDTGPKVTQSNVAMLASQALARERNTRVQLLVRLELTAPMLMHRWTTKAIVKMLGKMTNQETPLTAKDLTEEFEASSYRNIDGAIALPCRLIKAATIEGAISTGGVTSKAELRRGLRVIGYTAPINLSGEIEMDVRIARNTGGTPDVRSRAIVPMGSWMDVVLQFPTSLTPDKVMAALEAAGDTIGLCELRPERGGELGTFRVLNLRSEKKEIDKVIKACSVPEETFKIPPEMLRAFRAIPEEELRDPARKVGALIDHVNGQKRGSSKAEKAEKAEATP